MAVRKVPGEPGPGKIESDKPDPEPEPSNTSPKGTEPAADQSKATEPDPPKVSEPKPKADPFDLMALRLDPREMLLGPKKEIMPVVRKPGPQMYFRARPGADYTITTAILKLDGEAGNKSMYWVAPELWEGNAKELRLVTFYTCVTTTGDVMLWPISAEPAQAENKWISTCYDAVESAMRVWTRVSPNTKMGFYDVWPSDSNHLDPVWPDLSLRELLMRAFKGFVIDDPDHVVLQRLRGKFT